MITGSRTQSMFEVSLPTSTISAVTNPIASLDGMERTRIITDSNLGPNGILGRRLDSSIGHLSASPLKNRRYECTTGQQLLESTKDPSYVSQPVL